MRKRSVCAGLGMVSAVLAGFSAYFIVDTGDTRKGLGTLASFLALALLAFAMGRRRAAKWQGRFLYALFLIFACELLLQGAALLSAIPALGTYEHVPYGRVYWAKEGFSNGSMNRYGWHAPAFDLESGKRRVVVIGDSFVQAATVESDEGMGPRLDSMLDDVTVLTLGRSAIGPAHYLELLRYATERFAPQEAVLVLYVGNDFSDLDPVRRGRKPARYLYLDADLRPLDVRPQELFRARLAFNHRPAFLSLPEILRSGFLLPKVLKTITRAARHPTQREPESLREELIALGLDPTVFEVPPAPEVVALFELAETILAECQAEAARHDIKLRLVTIPFFPTSYYDKLLPGNIDLAAPERRLMEFARARKIDILPLGERMRQDGLDPAEIHTLYFNGTGHFTRAGHEYAAQAMARAFFGS